MQVRLTQDIYDDGADHHPPQFMGYKGDIVWVHSTTPHLTTVSHNNFDDVAFTIYPGEYEDINNENT
jgi:hypothetical protein